MADIDDVVLWAEAHVCEGCGGGKSSLDSENKALVVGGDMNPWYVVWTDRRVDVKGVGSS